MRTRTHGNPRDNDGHFVAFLVVMAFFACCFLAVDYFTQGAAEEIKRRECRVRAEVCR